MDQKVETGNVLSKIGLT